MRKEQLQQLKERARKVLLKEGNELTNAQILERFPGLSMGALYRLREELNIPAPKTNYLSAEDMKNAQNVITMDPKPKFINWKAKKKHEE